jgi:His-Xaa-Ser system protein HxsD
VNATFLQADGGGLFAVVDLGVYDLSALLRVAYRFTDRCYLHLQKRTEHLVEVRFRPKAGEPPLDKIAGEFCNELLDQSLREIVARESEPVRNLILAHALSRTPFVDPELETTNPFAAPQSNAGSSQ